MFSMAQGALAGARRAQQSIAELSTAQQGIGYQGVAEHRRAQQCLAGLIKGLAGLSRTYKG